MKTKRGRDLMKTLTKIEVLEDAKKYFGIEKISNIMLKNYIAKGLIKRIKHYHIKGVRGSVATYPKNTPGILYLITVCKTQGIKLKEISGYLSLFALDQKAVRDIKDIIAEDRIYKENILFNEGITPEVKEYLLNEVPLKLLNLRNLTITRLEIFKRIIELRAYAELNYKKITEIIIEDSKDQKSFHKIQEILDSPKIYLDDIENAEISVIYEKPFNINVLFKENEIEIIR